MGLGLEESFACSVFRQPQTEASLDRSGLLRAAYDDSSVWGGQTQYYC